MLDVHICERARLARDVRFDGLFFTGVMSTGIFCRPICPAPQPKARNVVYFASAAAAAAAGLRPCLRCRPEAAPGTPAWNGTSATVSRALALVRQGALNAGGIAELAARLGVGARQLRRLFAQHLGASPIAMANTQRVLFAKKMLAETACSITEIALSSGFGSLRRFNAAFRDLYGRSPSDFRRELTAQRPAANAWFECTLTLPYRPPYHWARMLSFFRARAIPGVEHVTAEAYHRTLRSSSGPGKLQLFHAPSGHALILKLSLPDSRGLLPLVERVRRMFDLDANLEAVYPVLMADEQLAPLVLKFKGMRLPGAWDPFETAVRAVVGQQISIKAARTLLGRIAAIGPPAALAAAPGLARCFPTAEELLTAACAPAGINARRWQTLVGLAGAVANQTVDLSPHTDLEKFVQDLTRLPGVGPWTAQYIALRALGEPDAFPAADLGLSRALSRNGPKPTQRRIVQMAEAWRPWRAYAATYLWQSLTADAGERIVGRIGLEDKNE